MFIAQLNIDCPTIGQLDTTMSIHWTNGQFAINFTVIFNLNLSNGKPFVQNKFFKFCDSLCLCSKHVHRTLRLYFANPSTHLAFVSTGGGLNILLRQALLMATMATMVTSRCLQGAHIVQETLTSHRLLLAGSLHSFLCNVHRCQMACGAFWDIFYDCISVHVYSRFNRAPKYKSEYADSFKRILYRGGSQEFFLADVKSWYHMASLGLEVWWFCSRLCEEKRFVSAKSPNLGPKRLYK